MTAVMFGPLVLFAASLASAAPATTPVIERASAQQPRISATATVSIRIISGVRFGSKQLSGAAGAVRRTSVLADADGFARPAEILEFQ